MIDPRHLHAAAVRFGPFVGAGSMGFDECHAMLCRAALNNPACQGMPPAEFDALCTRLAQTLGDAAERPALSAAQAVRDVMRRLMARRTPRDTVMLAAYRAAGDDLTAHEVESIARDEVSHYLEARHAG